MPASHPLRESIIKLKAFPTHKTLKDWKSNLVTSVIAASDRKDDAAGRWVMEAFWPEIPIEDLGVVPEAFVRLDRKLAKAVKDILPTGGHDVTYDIAAEEQSQQGLAQVATKLQQAETQSEHLDEQFLRT